MARTSQPVARAVLVSGHLQTVQPLALCRPQDQDGSGSVQISNRKSQVTTNKCSEQGKGVILAVCTAAWYTKQVANL